MKCRKCGEGVEKGWKFCPRCGSGVSAGIFPGLFRGFDRDFADMGKEMDEMEKMLQKNMEVFDLSPWVRKAPKSGFSIQITQKGNGKPEVSVHTLDDGRRQPAREAEKAPQKAMVQAVKKRPEAGEVDDQPRTDVKRIGNRIIVEVQLPGVRSADDIDVTPLESSIEIRAYAGNKAYFRILKKPPQYSAIRKSFANGVLTLDFS